VYAARHRVELAGKPATPLPLRTAQQALYIAVAVAIAAA
jgi:hypothetical protein